MKYLIVVLVVVLVGWLLLRGNQRDRMAGRRAATGRPPQEVVQCQYCGVHLPRVEALIDKRGAFCTEIHRKAGSRPA